MRDRGRRDLPKEPFVTPATAIAFVVDAARMPVYVVAERAQVMAILPLVLIATAGVFAGRRWRGLACWRA